jgi:hypothetical protein
MVYVTNCNTSLAVRCCEPYLLLLESSLSDDLFDDFVEDPVSVFDELLLSSSPLDVLGSGSFLKIN